MRLTVAEFAKHFKMSKEMILSKIKAKQLQYIKENGAIYIVVPPSLEKHIQTQQQENLPMPHKQKTTVATVLALYQKENQQLKEKIVQLEAKIDKLIDDKEQMLRDEMSKIEEVYSAKDEQLKSILELINTKLINESNNDTIHDVQTLESIESQIVELKSYLKGMDLESYQKKIIKKRFLAVYGKDVRVIKQNGKFYLDFSKYDYSDLLEY
jgi:ribosomal protein S15P/S13E